MSATLKTRSAEIRKAFVLGVHDLTGWAADAQAEYAIEEAPEKTGNLKSKIRSVWRNQYRKDAVSEAEYSLYVNEGTSRQAANPFWDRALSRVSSEFAAKAREIARERFGGGA